MIAQTSPELSVFVPAALTVGLLVSLTALGRDAVHRLRGHQWLERRAVMNGRAMALITVRDEVAARTDAVGRRPRLFYAVVGGLCLGLALYLTLGAYGNYIGWTGWVETIGWIWWIYLVWIGVFTAVGVCSMAVALRWDAPPTWTRPVLARTPLSSVDVAARPARRKNTTRPARAPRGLLGPEQIDGRLAARLRTIAALWTTVSVLVLSLLALEDRIPQAADPGILEVAVSGPVQIGLLAVITIGSMLCGRHEAGGATLMAGAGAALAFMSAVQYPPWVAVGVALAFGTPAFLHWLAWQRDRHIHHLVTLAVATAVLIAGLGLAADALYDRLLGPSHPASLTAAPARADVAWAWAGGTTSRSTTVVVKLTGREQARLHVADEQAPGAPALVVDGASVSDEIRRFEVQGLQPDHRYTYGVEVAGRVGGPDGRFRTFPEGAADFTIAFGSCSRTGSNGAVYDRIREEDPLLYLAVGDLNYANVRGDDLERFLRAYDRTLAAPAQGALYRSTSTGYVWDDHDYGGNDANRLSPSRAAAQTGYRLTVPHYPLAAPMGDGATYQSFTVGRLRVVLTDLRSHRDPANDPAATRSLLGPVQLAWFEDQLRAAAADGQAILWASASPWIDDDTAGGDSWGGYDAERRRIGALVRELGLGDRLLMIGGDAHMAAFDDGTHAAYDGPGSGFPVVHAGALDRPGGLKGGPYTEGPFPGGGQYGTLDVRDDGGPSVEITVTARTWDGRTLLQRAVQLRTTGPGDPRG